MRSDIGREREVKIENTFAKIEFLEIFPSKNINLQPKKFSKNGGAVKCFESKSIFQLYVQGVSG